MDNLNFAQMLCSRLCHDLITPVGAVNSGLEIIQDCEEEQDQQQLLELIQQSAKTAARRLTFYRAAYGNPEAAMTLKYLSVKQLIQDFLTPLKIHLDWPSCESCHQDVTLIKDINLWVKILMNVVLMITEGFPYGGEIFLKHHRHQKQMTFTFQGQGRFKGFHPDSLAVLTHGLKNPEDLTPYVIQAVLLRKIIEELSATFKISDLNENGFKIEIIQQI